MFPDRGATSARQEVENCLAQIARHNADLGIVITTMPELSRDLAKDRDAAADRGRWLGVAHGLTVALKDNIDTGGIRTTSGSSFFRDHTPERDARVVERLLGAGAIPIAKVNMAEFAFGATSQNAHFGSCRNPWDFRCIPGGSSGGSGAAVAAGMATIALGTDTAGSVRLPAALNGVSGLRPTLGRVPNIGTTPVSTHFDTVGPLAWSTADVARALLAIEGWDPSDPSSIRGPADSIVDQMYQGAKGLRIAVPTHFFWDDLHPDIDTSVRAAVDVFSDLGAEIIETRLEGSELTQEMMRPLLHADIAAFHKERLRSNPEGFGEDVYRRLQIGLSTSGVEYSEARSWRQDWIRYIDKRFEDFDLILTPTVPVPAPLIDGAEMISATTELTRLTAAWSMANIPALSIPCGFDSSGLPLGLQLASRQWKDGLVLRAGISYQDVTDWHAERPRLLAPQDS